MKLFYFLRHTSTSAFLLLYMFILGACSPFDNSYRNTDDNNGSNTSQPTQTPTPTPTVSSTYTPSPGPTATSSPGAIPPNKFYINGRITYDYVIAQDGVNEPGIKLNYSTKTARPVKRVVIQALEAGTVVEQTTTDDDGKFVLYVQNGKTVRVRVRAWLLSANYLADGIGQNNCNNSAWDVKIVDNTQSKGNYVMDSPNEFGTNYDNFNFHAPLSISGSTYTNRAAAPFAMLDTVVSEFELLCQGQANISFPALLINWSPNNAPVSGNKALGEIGTSHFTFENGAPQLYILGKENVDTDEFDDHVMAHELGHYIENTLYRADTPGGSHSLSQTLDPRLAFSEGFGNALSAMTFNDSFYVDTSGNAQVGGFSINTNNAPTGDGRGLYSEVSVQYFLWSLFKNKLASSNLNPFSRIHNILANFQKNTPAFTTLQSFAAYYNAQYGGAAENLQNLWSNDLDIPYASLCVGGCTGSQDTADPFDLNNDFGLRVCAGCASERSYPQGIGPKFSADFWSLFRTLVSGVNAATAHDQTNFGAYSYTRNKFGGIRWYRFVGTGLSHTLSVSGLGGGISCDNDVLDLYVYNKGNVVTKNDDSSGSQAGCPSVTFGTVANEIYLITINTYNATEVPSWTMTISP
ncbi:MAG: hypothetical protein HY072_09535 [Deltaproteobacteria bacterium]|nr:hypothetical protein [Deltaproteobacteria bacterium]